MDTCNVWLSLFTVHLKLSAIPQYKIKSLKLKKIGMRLTVFYICSLRL